MPDKTLIIKAKVTISLDELSWIIFTTDINTWYPNDVVEILTNLATLIADLYEMNQTTVDQICNFFSKC